MQLSKVLYDEAEFQKKYDELKQYHVDIPEDPVSLGFSGLAAKIAEVQRCKDRVSEMWNESSLVKTKAKVYADSSEYVYQSKLDVIIDTDPEIIALPSDRTKLARANKKLAVELKEMQEAEFVYKLVNAYFNTVANTFNNLESVNKNLTEQLNIYKKLSPPTEVPKQVPGSGSSVRVCTEV